MTTKKSPKKRERDIEIDVYAEIQNVDFKIIPLKFKSQKQKDFFDLCRSDDSKLVICDGPAGSGKAQPLDSNILTPYGWKKMGEISIGDNTYNEMGEEIKIVGIFPQGEKEIFRVEFEDGSYTECCDDHLWFTQTYNDKNHRIRIGNRQRKKSPKDGSVKSLKEIRQTLFSEPVGKKIHLNHYIPMVKPIKFKPKEYVIHPYVLGCLIGDGSFMGGCIGFTTADDQIINEMSCFISEDYHFNKINNNRYGYYLSKKEKNSFIKNIYLNELKKLNLHYKRSEEKSIPKNYLIGSVEQRIELLQGLMDTDGTCGKNGFTSSFSTSSFTLAQDFKELINSLGGTVTISLKKTSHLPNYICLLKLPPEIIPFKLERKRKLFKPKTKYLPIRRIKNVISIGKKECQCIKVDCESELYVTDQYIVTHNTLLATYAALKQIKAGKYERLMYVRTPVESSDTGLGFMPGDLFDKTQNYMIPMEEKMAKLLDYSDIKKLLQNDVIESTVNTFMRGRSIDNTIVIIDEVANFSMKEILNVFSRFEENTKIIAIGDHMQSDIGLKSCLTKIMTMFDNDEAKQNGVHTFRFNNEDIVRSGLTRYIVEVFEKHMKISRGGD